MATERQKAAKELENARQNARELERAGKLTEADVERVRRADVRYTNESRQERNQG